MGSGYNGSVAASRSARTKASTRTPLHFYLSVPMYQYDLGCGKRGITHVYLTRTPLVAPDFHTESGDEMPGMVWCSRCQNYTAIAPDIEPLNQPVSNDEKINFEQDKGLLRERVAMVIQDMGYLESDEQIAKVAVEFGIPVGEVKKINAGLKAPEGMSGQTDRSAGA